jgi:4a-hydroxytetrahydrobiopterin dehydratase
MTELTQRKCVPCEGNAKPLGGTRIKELMTQLDSRWRLLDDGKQIEAGFEFKNYFRTTAFVNAVAWIAHQEDHHPDIRFGYKTAQLSYSTHAIGGLSENDFICAAKVDALLR